MERQRDREIEIKFMLQIRSEYLFIFHFAVKVLIIIITSNVAAQYLSNLYYNYIKLRKQCMPSFLWREKERE